MRLLPFGQLDAEGDAHGVYRLGEHAQPGATAGLAVLLKRSEGSRTYRAIGDEIRIEFPAVVEDI